MHRLTLIRRCRAGFTLLEMVVALTMIVVMLAVIVPSVTTRIRQAQVTSLNTTLDALLTGIRNYKANVTRYPQRLQQLSWAPTTNRPYDICTPPNNILGFASRWRGPYVSLQIDSTVPGDPTTPRGVPIGDYVANDLLVRTPTTSTTPGRIDIQVPGVSQADWLRLNIAEDGQTGSVPPLKADGSDTAGTVQWDAPSGLLSYGMVITGC